MRKLVLIFTISLLSNFINAQCDSSIIKVKYDEFDKTKRNESIINLSNENNVQFTFEMVFIKRENYSNYMPANIGITARITNEGPEPRNVGEYSYIHFLFEDGTSEKLNSGDSFGSYFKSTIWLQSFDPVSENRLKPYIAVKYKKLKAIRFYRGNEKIDFNLTEQQKIEIQKKFNCITE